MILIFALGILIGLPYFLLVYYFLHHWAKLPEWTIPLDWKPSQTKVSILIPARNEANNIKACISSILMQDYPPRLFEVIVIDDFSTDETASIVSGFKEEHVKVYSLSDYPLQTTNSFKKAALELGVSHALGDLIVTTDADCIVDSSWLSCLVAHKETQGKTLLAAPVIFHQDSNLLEHFQALDYMGMMLMTGAGIQSQLLTMSNGANLAYDKTMFEKINGFENINQVASGDDMLFVQKVLSDTSETIGFVKSTHATVKSLPQKTWKAFFNQRLRWAGKTSAYTDNNLRFTQVLVFLTCAAIIILPFFSIVLGSKWLIMPLMVLLIKMVADYYLLKRAAQFFGRSDLLRIFLSAELIHTLYIFIVGLTATFVKQYEWKGRRVK